MKNLLMGAVASAALMLGAEQAWALGAFNFAAAPNLPAGLKGSSLTANSILAEAFVYTTPGGVATYTDSLLYLRNQDDDHGLGVCSEGGATACDPATGNGDVNELDNMGNNEVIRLTLPDGEKWTSLWVSSLDGGGSGGSEEGRAYFSNLDKPLLSSITGIDYSYNAAGLPAGINIEGDLFSLTGFTTNAAFNATAKYIYFIAGPSGDNNDYLIWKGTTAAVPIPAALPMLLAALGGLGFAGRRSNRRPA